MDADSLSSFKEFNLTHPPTSKMIVKISSDFKSVVISDQHEQFIYEELGHFNR